MSKRPLATAAEGLPSPTISQRVNAIFAAYVATEAEQARLGALNTPEADAQADKLGDTALSLAKNLESVVNCDANPDLVAARALHELMLAHPWNKLGSFEWGYGDREALVTVSLVANATTGAVREQVRRVMRTKGIEIAEAPSVSAACPMEALIADYDRASEAYDAIRGRLEDDEAQQLYDATIEPLRSRMFDAPPVIATRKGAADALRLVLADTEFQGVERSLTNAVLAFIETVED